DLDGLLSTPEMDDLTYALKFASEMNSSAGDDLVRKAFMKKVDKNPKEAFQLLGYLPKYMQEELSKKLAHAWGKQNGREAATAFVDYPGVIQWRNQVTDALQGWAEIDATSAYGFLSELQKSRSDDGLDLMYQFLSRLSFKNAPAAAQLLRQRMELPGAS